MQIELSCRPSNRCRSIPMRSCLFLLALTVQATSLCLAQLVQGPSVAFEGEITEPTQLSDVAAYKDLLAICPDEGCQFDGTSFLVMFC